MDNYGTHGTPEVKTWLRKHPRFAIHYVPTSCSWLNLDREFPNILRRNQCEDQREGDVLYAGSSPGNVAGVMEVEAVVPATAASGADAVLLSVGTAGSQANVVVNVK